MAEALLQNPDFAPLARFLGPCKCPDECNLEGWNYGGWDTETNMGRVFTRTCRCHEHMRVIVSDDAMLMIRVAS